MAAAKVKWSRRGKRGDWMNFADTTGLAAQSKFLQAVSFLSCLPLSALATGTQQLSCWSHTFSLKSLIFTVHFSYVQFWYFSTLCTSFLLHVVLLILHHLYQLLNSCYHHDPLLIPFSLPSLEFSHEIKDESHTRHTHYHQIKFITAACSLPVMSETEGKKRENMMKHLTTTQIDLWDQAMLQGYTA